MHPYGDNGEFTGVSVEAEGAFDTDRNAHTDNDLTYADRVHFYGGTAQAADTGASGSAIGSTVHSVQSKLSQLSLNMESPSVKSTASTALDDSGRWSSSSELDFVPDRDLDRVVFGSGRLL